MERTYAFADYHPTPMFTGQPFDRLPVVQIDYGMMPTHIERAADDSAAVDNIVYLIGELYPGTTNVRN